MLQPVEPARIEVDRSDTGVAVVVISGEHDVSTAPVLRDRIGAIIEEGAPLMIDLTPATFVDSSVLRVLLDARRRSHEQGRGFAVALEDNDAAEVRRILEVTGLMSVLPVLTERGEAIEAARIAPEAS
jgi:anti-sigma B factor antagonist